jgi:hypothetical protein
MLKAVSHLSLRATQGFLESVKGVQFEAATLHQIADLLEPDVTKIVT